MTETTNINVSSKNVGAKPRLSLLSSKQAVTRLNSDDFSLDQPEFCSPPYSSLPSNGLIGKTNNETINNINNNNSSTTASLPFATKADITSDDNVKGSPYFPESVSTEASTPKQALQPDQPGNSQQRGLDKLSVSKEDLIALLSMLKSELQSKEIALASMKLEQLKRLMNPVEISRSTLAKTYLELQDRLEIKEKLKNSNTKQKCSINLANSSASNSSSDAKQIFDPKNQEDNSNDNIGRYDEESDQETIEILSTLLELLDRHPLLALPRDSIYCLDYNCNELSTKNYLNLKIQHLENLIEQHRKFRYHIKERLKRSEQRSLDLSLQLELERKLRADDERSDFRNSGEAVLIGHIDRLKEDLEKEKASKHAIVMTLLNELLDEKDRNATLSEMVTDLEKKLSIANRTQQHATTPPMTTQQSICKPKVPVKPAQLLDRQLTQSKNK